MKIKVLNRFTGNINEMEIAVTDEQIAKWKSGMLIQNAMPDLTPTEREFMMTGMTVEEQKALYGH